MKTLRLVALLLLCASAGFSNSLCSDSAYSLTSAGWADGCYTGDKEFTNFTYDPGSSGITSVDVSIREESGVYSVVFSPASGSWISGIFTLSYQVMVLSPSFSVVAASLDPAVTLGGGTVTVVDTITNGATTYATMTSIDGSHQEAAFSLQTLQVTINGDLTSNESRSLSNITTGFLQSDVPEPVTIALVGGGFLVLGLLRRFRF